MQPRRIFHHDDVLSAPVEGAAGRYDPFGASTGMREVKRALDRVARTDVTVLISGESGVGKELVARAIHRESSRRDRAFLKVGCLGLPVDLLDGELFGWERGTLAGAYHRKPGKLELVNGGTIFVDDVGELPAPLQGKLFGVLHDRAFPPLGDSPEVRTDARLIASTTADLAGLVERGRFREDLYHEVCGITIHVPPLRARREEIPFLVDLFIARYARQYLRPRPVLSAAASRLLRAHAWPGNLPQLESIVRRLVLLGTEDWLAHELREPETASPSRPMPILAKRSGRSSVPVFPDEGIGLKAIARAAATEAEREALARALNSVRWNRRAAARQLKVSYKTLRRKIEQCGLED